MVNPAVVKSLRDVEEKSYPIFQTIYNLLYLVNFTLREPFFKSFPTEEAQNAGVNSNVTVSFIDDVAEKFALPP